MYLFGKSGNVHTEKMANANACEKSLKQRNPDILEASSNPFQTPETRQRKTGIMEKVPTTKTIKKPKIPRNPEALSREIPIYPKPQAILFKLNQIEEA